MSGFQGWERDPVEPEHKEEQDPEADVLEDGRNALHGLDEAPKIQLFNFLALFSFL
jgi:hypothetical protein